MISQSQQLYERVATELSERIAHEFGDQIEIIILYGSVARVESNENSDIDLLIVSSAGRALFNNILSIAYDVDLKYETLTTFTIYTPPEFEERIEWRAALIEEVLSEGIPLYGQERFIRYQRALQIS